MARVLYFDCFAGASGDMILGALLDAGLPLEELRRALGSLALDAADIGSQRVSRAGVAATKFRVYGARGAEAADHHPHDHHAGHHHHDQGPAAAAGVTAFTAHPGPETRGPAAERRETDAPVAPHAHRTLAEIGALIDRSALSSSGRRRARELFERLAGVEASIHQMPLERVHLHEVGALDSIVDIVGAVFALEWFKPETIVASPLNVGGGMVQSAHGLFPVPAPATATLLRGAPIYSSGIEAELVTPTGALLITSYAASYGPVPAMMLERVGYGAGDRDFPSTPNVLRVLIGQAPGAGGTERVLVIECEIDDMNPQIFGALMERLYAAGALEVFYAPVQMKKNRPGTLVTIVAPREGREALAAIVFRETTTIGLRYQEVERERLERETISVETPIGAVRFKVARRGGAVVNAAPEFDDCARLAAERGLSIKQVQAIATKAYLDRTVA